LFFEKLKSEKLLADSSESKSLEQSKGRIAEAEVGLTKEVGADSLDDLPLVVCVNQALDAQRNLHKNTVKKTEPKTNAVQSGR
jgi:hypothetical protein